MYYIMRALVLLRIVHRTTFEMPSFINIKDMTEATLKNESRDPDHAH